MGKIFTSLGLMSGTSMDGVDASIIKTDGKSKYNAILDKYFEYPYSIYRNLTKLRDKIKSSKDLKKHQKQVKTVEKEITIFHAKAVNEILAKKLINVDFIGFHGQTIFHNAGEKITKQIGDGKLLSKITKKTVIYDFRQNDLKNDGQGAPLTPIFHKLLAEKFNLAQNNISSSTQATFVNIGGISNLTRVNSIFEINSLDCGPGMCLIDKWIRLNLKKKIDKDGKIAKKGNINNEILFKYKKKIDKFFSWGNTFDINDFNINLIKKLSLADGAATLIELTIRNILSCVENTSTEKTNFILCGGGRKNKFLIHRLKKIMREKGYENLLNLKMIDEFGIDGDFIESQAFAYLAIRSYLKLPISFPSTTGCNKPCTGGVLIKNY
tara:strand:- start:306 stop:1448 length:1143 start_codon:yes stop_codon:yes gene_type:complete